MKPAWFISGHGRVEAARKLGLSEAPVMVAVGWSEAKKRAYIIADNKLALNAGWNDELLVAELSDLKDLAFDLDLVGIDAGAGPVEKAVTTLQTPAPGVPTSNQLGKPTSGHRSAE
jgi:ParB-like chromosome segregation protein Spo0J